MHRIRHLIYRIFEAIQSVENFSWQRIRPATNIPNFNKCLHEWCTSWIHNWWCRFHWWPFKILWKVIIDWKSICTKSVLNRGMLLCCMQWKLFTCWIISENFKTHTGLLDALSGSPMECIQTSVWGRKRGKFQCNFTTETDSILFVPK